jgi:hypothetical protein
MSVFSSGTEPWQFNMGELCGKAPYGLIHLLLPAQGACVFSWSLCRNARVRGSSFPVRQHHQFHPHSEAIQRAFYHQKKRFSTFTSYFFADTKPTSVYITDLGDRAWLQIQGLQMELLQQQTPRQFKLSNGSVAPNDRYAIVRLGLRMLFWVCNPNYLANFGRKGHWEPYFGSSGECNTTLSAKCSPRSDQIRSSHELRFMETPSPRRTTNMFSSPSRNHTPRSSRRRSSPRKGPRTPKPNQNATPPRPHKLSHTGHILHHSGSSKRTGSDTIESYTVCDDHVLCEYVGLQEFLDVLKFVQYLAVAVSSIMKGDDYIQGIYSQEEVENAMEESDMDWVDTCRYCWLAGFLRGHASHVWWWV